MANFRRGLNRLLFRLRLRRGVQHGDGRLDHNFESRRPVFFGLMSVHHRVRPFFCAYCREYDICHSIRKRQGNAYIVFAAEEDRARYEEVETNSRRRFVASDIVAFRVWLNENSAFWFQKEWAGTPTICILDGKSIILTKLTFETVERESGYFPGTRVFN